MHYSKNCKHNSLVAEDKLSMITTIHFEGAYVTWKGQVRFLRFMGTGWLTGYKVACVKPTALRDVKNWIAAQE